MSIKEKSGNLKRQSLEEIKEIIKRAKRDAQEKYDITRKKPVIIKEQEIK